MYPITFARRIMYDRKVLGTSSHRARVVLRNVDPNVRKRTRHKYTALYTVVQRFVKRGKYVR